MIGFLTLDTIFKNLFDTLLVQKIYHDVILILQKDKQVPVYKSGSNWIQIGLDDRKALYCYIRQLGEAVNSRTEYVGSPQKMYWLKVNYRFVFFNAHETRNFDDLTNQIINIAFGQYIDLIRIQTDINQLQLQEGTINEFELTAKAFYMALDISLTQKINKDNCEMEVRCETLENPLCKS